MAHAILGAFAHPDDEIFGTGGTFARYALAGVDVHLVCATKGEVGEIAEPHLATPETLAAVRTDELRCSAKTLGLQEPHFLGYRDSGMADTPENDDPRAFVNAPDDEVVRALVAIMRRVRPAAVVTFDERGGYGHPDHIAIHRHTVRAFHKAADLDFAPDLGDPWRPDRLFFRAMSRGQLEAMRDGMASVGIESGFYAYHEEHGMVWPDDRIDLTVDVQATVDRKLRAFRCHATQFGPNHAWRRAPQALVQKLMSREQFVLAHPTGGAATLYGLLDEPRLDPA